MEHVHVNKVQERCRVCGRLLVAPRDKKARQSYQCTEFSADLHSVFGIDTHNDAVNIHPLKFCKQVMDGSILAQCQHSTLLVQFLMSGRNTLLRNARFVILLSCLNK